MKSYLSQSIALAMLLFPILAHGKVIYVNGAIPAGGDGATWPTACRYLQDALDKTVAGDEVWVAAGTYYPDDGAAVTTGDRTATFTLKQDVKLYGGFLGGETAIKQQRPKSNVTVLSGEIWTEKLYWSLHVVTLAGSATLDGVTITSSNANGDAAPFNQGGGIYGPASSSLLTLEECNLNSNSATNGGGAIYLYSSNIIAKNCNFSGNSARSGGGINSKVSLSNCTFSNNSSTSGNGGAIIGYGTVTDCSFVNNSAPFGAALSCNTLYQSITAINCNFSGNTSTSGAAIWALSDSQIIAKNCMFSSNSASVGGAIYGHGMVTATNCVFSENSAIQKGGAVFTNTTFDSVNCVFSGNTVTSTSSYFSRSGGAVYSSSLIATNCGFFNNSAWIGGAVYSSSSSTTNCTFFDNQATGTERKAAAIYASGTVKIINCILWHSFTNSANLIFISSSGTLSNQGGSFTFPSDHTKNLIKGGTASLIAEAGATISLGNTAVTILSSDPLFINPSSPKGSDGVWKSGDDGLRLRATSPAINQGLATGLPADTQDLDQDGNTAELIPVDLVGYERIQGATPDLGAYEAGDVVLPVAILTQPVSLTQLRNLKATFTVKATGYALHYQWYLGNTGNVSNPVTGATGNSYTTPELTTATSYWVRVSNGLGFVNSQTAKVTINQPAAIASQPASTTINNGGTVKLVVVASGTAPFSYQWYKGFSGNTTTPVGTNSASFNTPPLTVTTRYWVKVMNSANPTGVNSKTATVTVNPSSVATLSNLVPSAGTLSPAFTSTTMTYTVSVPNSTSSINVTPTKTDANATFRVNGKVVASGTASAAISLPVGTTSILVAVTAQDGTTVKTYTVTVSRAASTMVSSSGFSSAAPQQTISKYPEITKIVIDSDSYKMITLQKSDVVADNYIVEVSPNLTDWYSGKNYTTTILDTSSILVVRDNTPIRFGSKRYIRVRNK